MPDATERSVHVVCFEEAGDCTLERIAREARDADRVVVLGPQEFAAKLRGFGLAPSVVVEAVGRAAGRFAARTPRVRSTEFPATAGAATRVIAYGMRAGAWADRALAEVGSSGMAGVPAELPPEPSWPEGRRARVRRELGITAFEHAVLIAGDPSEWIDPSFAIRALSMAFVAGAPIRIVVSPRTARIAKMTRFIEDAAGGRPIIADARADHPWELLPALDAMLLDQDGAATNPVECAGWRVLGATERTIPVQPVSPLPALWGIACGKPSFVHASVELGAHADHPLVVRFADDVAQLAREIHARSSSASAASR